MDCRRKKIPSQGKKRTADFPFPLRLITTGSVVSKKTKIADAFSREVDFSILYKLQIRTTNENVSIHLFFGCQFCRFLICQPVSRTFVFPLLSVLFRKKKQWRNRVELTRKHIQPPFKSQCVHRIQIVIELACTKDRF